MTDEHVTTQSAVDRISLQAIEAEGTKATKDLAHNIVRESVKNKGQIDLVRLDRGGPAVRMEVFKLLAKSAASVRPVPDAAPATPRDGTPKQQKNATAAVKKTQPASTGPIVSPSALRATKGWRDKCRGTRGFKADAYRCGLVVSTTTAVVSMALLLILKS